MPEYKILNSYSLDTEVYGSERFSRESTFDVQTNYKETGIFQYLNFH